MYGSYLGSALTAMFYLSVVGALALAAGALYGAYWLFTHLVFI